jgi:hypothetical protein
VGKVATKSDKLLLAGKKKKLAELLANPDFNGTITELCEKIGVARSTFYKWLEDEDFTKYVNSLIDKYTDSELSSMWRALINRAKTGDVQAIKLYFELKGRYKTAVDLSGSAVVQIISDVMPNDDG